MADEVQINHVYERKIWIESDVTGSCHVMIQHQDGQSEPFCYCSFNYDYAYTCSSSVKHQAEAIAIQLGAKMPVETKSVSLGGAFRGVS